MTLGKLKPLIAVLIYGAIYTVVLCSGTAYAGYTHKLLFSFGPFVNAESIAVDDSTGDVYVLDSPGGGINKKGTLYKFNAAGEPTNFVASGTNVIPDVGGGNQIAVDNSSGPAKGDIYVAASGTGVLIFAATGELIGKLDENVTKEVPGAPYGSPLGVAVDAEGNVYVGMDYNWISRYTPTGNPVKNTDYTSSLWNLANAINVAADSEGSVWATEQGLNRLSKYDAMQFNSFGAAPTSSAKFSGGRQAVAIDQSSDDAYINQGKEILIYDATATFLEKIKLVEGSSSEAETQAIALNGTNKNVYAASAEHRQIEVFGPRILIPDVTTESPNLTASVATLRGTVNPDGVEANCYFEYGTSTSYGQTAPCAQAPGSGSSPVQVYAEVPGLQPGVFYHYRLVATNADGSSGGGDNIFALPVPPVVESEWATSVAISTAEVEGSIKAMGFETTFHIEYGTDASYGSSLPVPGTEIGSDTGAKTVRQLLTGLVPETTYHYRIVATNENGTTDGPDKVVRTLAIPPQSVADTCPNAAFRTGLSSNLPDCRAFEMVSPVDKNGANVQASGRSLFEVSDTGEKVSFWSGTGMADTHGSGPFGFSQYIASRTPTGWSTKGITPTPALNAPLQAFDAITAVLDFSSDFSRAVTLGYDLPGVEGAKPDSENLYLEDTSNARILATITDASNEGEDLKLFFTEDLPELGGSSSDMKVVSFASLVNLVPEAKGAMPKVYAYEDGEVKLVGVLPNGSVPPGGSDLVRGAGVSLPSSEGALSHKDTVSKDGSRIFFMSPARGSERQLYVRKDGTTSVLISEAEGSVPTVAQNVHFEAATPDGTKVIFSTTSRLSDSDPGGAGTALYLYTDGPDPEHEANLTFIARPDVGWSAEGSLVKGISEDASHIYFVGSDGLNLWDSGQMLRVTPVPDIEEAIVAADGRRLAFMSRDPGVTANEIGSLGGVSENTEIYVYSEDQGTLVCASCSQNGAVAMAGVQLAAHAEDGWDVSGTSHPRFFSNNGRYVFFNTSEALVAQDTNGVTDAYEYDTETNKLSLLSTGIGEDGTWFVQSSPDGRDVFLATRQRLSPWDPDTLVDLYDARAGGGLAGPPAAPAPCEGDECQGTPSAVPSFNTASGFEGLGNTQLAQSGKAKAKSLSNPQRLKQALVLCRKKPKHKRAACEAKARKRYKANKSAKRTPRTGR